MLANQPKNDTLYIKGFNIVVENRAFTYRQVAQNVGQKACLMPAHYGYLQNNPKVGVFVGAFPENDTVYLINQKAQGGYFDKHIAMFGFLSEQQAVDTYQKCFEYGYIGLMSVVPCTIEQLKWWLANGDKSRPVTKERLPYAGLERLDSVLWGGEDKADLASHSGQVAKLLYQIRQSDNFNHALEPLSYHDLTQELGNQGFVYENYDALVIERNKLERKAKQMLMAMQGAADIVKPVGVAVSKPLTKGGVANVVAWFEMDDGQAVGVFFHNPDKTPKKLDPTDEMISYKWVLNKKDITIVVAPENGKDLVIRTVAKRIMKLVDANHDRFLKANSDKAELNLKEQNLGQLVIEKQAELDALNKAIEALEAQKAEKENAIKENQVASQMENNQTNQEVNTPVTLTGKELENPTPPQERPLNWRASLPYARAVAKSLGIETKGKKLNTLLKEIDVFDENEIKKELLAEFKALASRLVLPKGYVFDLSNAEKSIGDLSYPDVSAFINKIGNVDKNDVQYVELRVSPRKYPWVLYGYTLAGNRNNPKVKDDFQRFPQSEEYTTAKDIVAKMEEFLTKEVFPKIEYLKVVNSTNVDVSKLSEIGIAEITDIGNENLYFEKDGKYYISKVGNPQLYALGEWDFAKYPDGKPVEPVVQTGARYESPKELFLKKANKAYKDLEDNGLKGFAKRANDVVQDVASNIGSLEDAEKRLNGIIYESENPLVSGEWRDLGDRKVYFWEDMRYGEIVDTRKTEGRSKDVSNPWRTGDGKLFESLPAAKKHELETTSKYRFINDGYMQKTKSSETQQPESEPLMKNQASGFIDDPKQKLGDEGKFNVPVNSSIVFESDKTGIYGEKVRVTKREFENAVTFDVELFEKDTNRWIEQKSYTDKDKAMIDAKGWEQGFNNSDRDYLQSIIDGSMTPKSSDMDVVIALTGKYETDEDMIPLLEQALEKINQTQQAAVKEVA